MAQKPSGYPKDMQRLSQSGPKPLVDTSKKAASFDQKLSTTTNTTFSSNTSLQTSQLDKLPNNYPKLYDFNPRNNQQTTVSVSSIPLAQSHAPYSSNNTQMSPMTNFQQLQPSQAYPQPQPFQQQFQQGQSYQQQPLQFQQFPYQQYQPTQQGQYPATQQFQSSQISQQSWPSKQSSNFLDTDGDELLKDAFRSTTASDQTKSEKLSSFSDPNSFFNQSNKFPPGMNQTLSYFSDIPMAQESDFSLLDPLKMSKSQISQQTIIEDEGTESSEESTSIFNSNTSKGAQIAEIMEAIAQSTHGASKYLHEVCDKMAKKGPTCDYTREIIDGQALFVATVTLDNFTSTKTGRSKQDAKNAGSLEVLKQFIESNDIAESSLKMILYKGKSV